MSAMHGKNTGQPNCLWCKDANTSWSGQNNAWIRITIEAKTFDFLLLVKVARIDAAGKTSFMRRHSAFINEARLERHLVNKKIYSLATGVCIAIGERRPPSKRRWENLAPQDRHRSRIIDIIEGGRHMALVAVYNMKTKNTDEAKSSSCKNPRLGDDA